MTSTESTPARQPSGGSTRLDPYVDRYAAPVVPATTWDVEPDPKTGVYRPTTATAVYPRERIADWPRRHVDDLGRTWVETEDSFYCVGDVGAPVQKSFWRRKYGAFPWEPNYDGDPDPVPIGDRSTRGPRR